MPVDFDILCEIEKEKKRNSKQNNTTRRKKRKQKNRNIRGNKRV